VEVPERPPWMRLAKCRGVSPDLFYPDKGGLSYGVAQRAKAVCNGEDGMPPCRVRQLCLEYAIVNSERFGVWGGKSERERNRLRLELWRQALDADEAGDHTSQARRRAQAIR